MTRPIKYGPWISRNPGDADPEPGMVQVRFANESRKCASTIRPPKLVSDRAWHVTDNSGSIHEYRRVIEPKVDTLRCRHHAIIGNEIRPFTILVDRIDGEIDWSTKRVEWDE